MKRVTLLRHAKSDWSDTTLRDFDRRLNGKGERAAALMGRWARKEALHFDAILASPAARVRDTLHHFLAGYGDCAEPAWDKRIYLASAATLNDVLADLDDEQNSILLVGHNPGLEEFILDQVPDDGRSRLRNDVAEKFPTASMAVLDFDVDRWEELGRGRGGPGKLRRFIRPRDLDPALGPEQV